MIKLNAGISRKVGEPDYGSRGASVNLELEVESSLVNDPNGLMDRIRRLFTLARQAVDQELNAPTPASVHTGDPARSTQTANGPTRNSARGNGTPRSATTSQLGAIRAIAERLNADPEALAHEAYGINLNQLTLRQASDLIDQLNAQGHGARR